MIIKNLDTYLNIDPSKTENHDAEALNHYIECFMLTVPFENISVQNGVGISTNIDDLHDKVVIRHRGGYCYELNTLFRYYLSNKGFRAFNTSATVHIGEGERSRPGSHMSTIVDIGDYKYVADVGFGDMPLSAIRLSTEENPEVTEDANGQYRAVFTTGKDFTVEKYKDGAWATSYETSVEPKELSDFEAAMKYNQSSPDSIFVKRLVISMPKRYGRVTMNNERLIITRNGEKEMIDITEDNYRTYLHEYFGIDETIRTIG